jgi:hypothetical protein
MLRRCLRAVFRWLSGIRSSSNPGGRKPPSRRPGLLRAAPHQARPAVSCGRSGFGRTSAPERFEPVWKAAVEAVKLGLIRVRVQLIQRPLGLFGDHRTFGAAQALQRLAEFVQAGIAHGDCDVA